MSDLKIDYGDLHAIVDEGHADAEARAARKGWAGRALRRLAWRVLALVAVAVLPFIVLIRTGTSLHGAFGAGAWSAVSGGVLATGALFAVYAWVAGRMLGGGRTTRRLLTRAAWGVGLAWVGYATVYVAGGNVKGEEVRAEYASLHPLLRLAASTVFLLDGETVLTDAGRAPEDYWRMGLPRPEASLHFPQEDGWVHAVDIRTRGRKEWRNRGLELLFWSIGLNTLRHVGTADHLHVSLRPPAG